MTLDLKLRATGAEIVQIDFTDEKTIIDTAKALEPEGPLDVLVNCGGNCPYTLSQ